MVECYPVDCYYTRALTLTKEVGEIIRDHVKKCQQIEMKSGPTDLVTEIDRQVEKHLFTSLKDSFQNHEFIGEESTADGHPVQLTDAPTWIIDPVDGTMNFVHSYPNFCVSIGLWIKKQPTLAFIYNPVVNHMFTAQKGKGSYLNGDRIFCSKETDLNKSLIIMEMGSQHDAKKMKTAQKNVATLLPQVHGFRASGSVALDMAAIAAGWADCFLDFGAHVWDVAAGVLLVQEGGGVVRDPLGGPHEPLSRRILCAGTQEVIDAIVPQLEQYHPIGD